jgi:putative cardiolipin synthase
MAFFAAIILLLIAGVLLLIAVLRLLHPLPSLAGRSESKALADTDNTPLGRKLKAARRKHAGLSGVHVISEGHEAYAARRALAKAAARCIDVQYYIWNGDLTGKLLILDLLEAADRGVRVRILLDDNPTAGLDALWSAVNAHENIEVRLFNPFTIRWPRSFNYLTDFKRLNRRMHNKSFTVDNQATIVGGRNIGDAYFNATDSLQFADMDLLAVGAVVEDVSREFDRYWASHSAYPAELLIAVSASELEKQRRALERVEKSADGRAYAEMADGSRLVDGLISGRQPLEWLRADLACDDPAKGLGDIPRRNLVVTGLTRRLAETARSLDIATAYFVPGRRGANFIGKLARSGRPVRVLTNSLASTDVAPVHAGYARYRRRLLRAGVKLYEMKPQAAPQREPSPENSARKFPRLGSSRSSLHAKLFLIDRERLFIGSFNLDPRSIYLNCEMGIMISSASIGEQLGRQFDRLAAQASFQPLLGRMGKLRWLDGASGKTAAVQFEPESTWWQRLMVAIISRLPVEWLL